MKRLLTYFVIASTAALAAPAAELELLGPADRTSVKGLVEFRLAPRHGPGDQFFSNPDIIIRDENSRQIALLAAPIDPASKVCSATWDTSKLKDGLYQIEVLYSYLVGGARKEETVKRFDLGVRNRPTRPARILFHMAGARIPAGESADFEVRVVDRANRPVPGVRVEFKVDQGELDTPAEITDSSGEAFGSVESEEPASVNLIFSVAGLSPVRASFQFVPPPADRS